MLAWYYLGQRAWSAHRPVIRGKCDQKTKVRMDKSCINEGRQFNCWLHHAVKLTVPAWPWRSGSPRKHLAQNSRGELRASREALEAADANFSVYDHVRRRVGVVNALCPMSEWQAYIQNQNYFKKMAETVDKNSMVAADWYQYGRQDHCQRSESKTERFK